MPREGTDSHCMMPAAEQQSSTPRTVHMPQEAQAQGAIQSRHWYTNCMQHRHDGLCVRILCDMSSVSLESGGFVRTQMQDR